MEPNTMDDELPATQILDDRVLKDVVAYVEVRSANDNRSSAFVPELERLGATVVKKFTNDVTHVIFKEGSKRTQLKAQKMGIHLVSVLWVDECKQHQKHAPESWFPATVPTASPFIIGKLKKAKSMQPVDFEEHIARSAERVNRKKKRLLKEMDRLRQNGDTPTFSPQGRIVVQDTQPRSPDEGFVLTPVRLTIPDTPPSMREKWRQIRQAKQEAAGSYTSTTMSDGDLEKEARYKSMEPLQKNLFKSTIGSSDSPVTLTPVAFSSTDDSSVFLSDDNVHTHSQERRNSSTVSDGSVNEDILSLVTSINTTLHKDKGTRRFLATESDDSLVHSQGYSSDTGNDADGLFKPLFFSTAEPGKSADCDRIEADAGNRRGRRSGKVCGKGHKRQSRLLSIQESIGTINDDSENGSMAEDFLDIITNDKETNKTLSDSVEVSHSSLSKTVDTNVSEGGSDVSAMNDSSKSQDNKCIRKKRVSRKSHGAGKLPSAENMDATEVSKCLTTSWEKDTSSLSEQYATTGSMDPSEQYATTDSMESENKMSCGTVVVENAEKTSKYVKRRTRSRAVCEPVHAVEEKDTSGKRSRRTTVSLNLVEGTSVSPVEKTKPKKMKKKLLSLTDLNDRHSILLEPTKATQVERPELLDGKVKAKATKKDKSGNSLQAEPCMLDPKTSVVLNDESEMPKRQRKGKRKLEANDDTPDSKRTKRKSRLPPTGTSKENVSEKVLVNDSLVKDTDMSVTSSRSTSKLAESHLQDLTTQLNLTKDATLPSTSSRDSTLSMSMSRVYTDANFPSFLHPPRRCSIDEFSVAMRNPAKRSMLKSSLLTLREENTGDQLSVTESENSLSSSTVGKQRKGKRPSLVMTSLHSCEQDVVISVVKKLGGFVIAEAVNETTTHVVCGESRRTLNLLQCLARGVWLLSKEWVLKSLESDCWIPEAEYECHDLFPTCKEARLERESCIGLYRQTVFTTVGLLYVSGRASPPRPQLVQLIKLCGGKVTGSLDKASIYVGSDFHPGLLCVKTNWLLDCVTSHCLLPTTTYSLDQPKRESSPVY